VSISPARFFSRLACAAALVALICRPLPAVADDTLTVVLAGDLPPLMDTLDLVAEGAGFYKAQHLTVKKLIVAGPAEALDACATNKADICPIGIERMFTGYEIGVHAQLFLAWASRYTYVMAVLEDSPIKSLADFKGKSVGVHLLGPTSTGQTTAISMLSNAGLKPSDYTLVPIGFNNLTVVTSKQVDGAAFPYYEMIPFQVGGTRLRIFENPILKETPSGGYGASPATIQTKSDQLSRFSRAIVEAALTVRLNPAGAARAMLQANGKPFTDADVVQFTRELTQWEGSLPAADPNNKHIGLFPLAGEEVYSKLLADYGLTKAPVPVSAVVTNQFNDFANGFDHAAVAAIAKQLP
jgi:NitT/TauT family transport system substrate-binding protein